MVCGTYGDTDRSLHYYQQVLESCKAHRQYNEVIYVVHVMVNARLHRGEFWAARSVIADALAFMRQSTDGTRGSVTAMRAETAWCTDVSRRAETQQLQLLLARVMVANGACREAVNVLSRLLVEAHDDRSAHAASLRETALLALAEAHLAMRDFVNASLLLVQLQRVRARRVAAASATQRHVMAYRAPAIPRPIHSRSVTQPSALGRLPAPAPLPGSRVSSATQPATHSLPPVHGSSSGSNHRSLSISTALSPGSHHSRTRSAVIRAVPAPPALEEVAESPRRSSSDIGRSQSVPKGRRGTSTVLGSRDLRPLPKARHVPRGLSLNDATTVYVVVCACVRGVVAALW